MDKKIEYTTIDEQITLLKSRGLVFDDENFAREQLKIFGYYSVVNNYESPYLDTNSLEKKFLPDTSFEQIFSLFTFDHNLRNSIMAAMLALEEHLKAVAAEVISSSFGINQNEYLKLDNYRDRRVKHERFGLKGIIEKLQRNLMSDKDPIRFFREKYSIVPPWILFKGTYFNTMVNFTKLFKEPQKKKLVELLYGCSEDLCMQKDVKTLLFYTLSLCLEYRNLAAHGGKVYDYNSDLKILLDDSSTISPLCKNKKDDIASLQGFCLLINLLDIFPYKQPYEIIDSAISKEIDRHLSLYDQDLTFLSKTLDITIYKK